MTWVALSALLFSASPQLSSFRVLEDREGLSAAEVAKKIESQPETTWLNLGWTRATAWFRFDVTGEEGPVVIDVGRPWLEEADLFALDEADNPVLVARSGATLPPSERSVKIEDIAVQVEVPASGVRHVLLRVRSRSPIAFHGDVYDLPTFQRVERRQQQIFGAYIAILLALALSSALIALALRRRTHIALAIVLVTFAFGESCFHGQLAWLFPQLGAWRELGAGALAFVFFIWFFFDWTTNALQLHEWSPRLARIGRRLTMASAAACLLAAVVLELSSVVFLALTMSCVVIMTAALGAVRRQVRSSGTFALACGGLILPSMVTFSTLFGLLPSWPATEYGSHFGGVVMACLLLMMVALELRAERDRVTSLSDELRVQVTSRSRELTDLLAAQTGPLSSRPLREDDLVGGRYRVRERLGAGGWGAVYEVERQPDGGRFALKMLMGASSGTEAARLAREAEIGARLHHPHLVPVQDVGVERGLPYVVMELMRGGSLEGRRASFGVEPRRSVWLRQVAEGLAALHREGVVHRDVKPANVLLDERSGDPVARLGDLGIARRSADEPLAPLPTEDQTWKSSDVVTPNTPSLTAVGAVMGTPKYMAPENAKGASQVGPPADVFSFGVMALEVLTGVPPWEDAPILAVIAGREPTAPRLASDKLEQKLLAALQRCLAFHPHERPTIDELTRLL